MLLSSTQLDSSAAMHGLPLSWCPSSFVEEVLNEYDLNDPAHMRQHAEDVVKNANAIIMTYPDELERYRVPIMLGAFLHDLKCHENRDQHHALGAMAAEPMLRRHGFQIIPTPDHGESHTQLNNHGELTTLTLYESDVSAIKYAILEHRASWRHHRQHLVSDVVATADRGRPDMYQYLRRAVLYRLAKLDPPPSHGYSDQVKCKVVMESIHHMIEKFGPGGYVYTTLPHYAQRLHAKEYQHIKNTLCSVDDANPLSDYAMNHFNDWSAQ